MPKIVSKFSPDIPTPPASTWLKPEVDAGNNVLAAGSAVGQQVEILLDAAGATFAVNVNSGGGEVFLQDNSARIASAGSVNVDTPDFSTSDDAEIGGDANVLGRLDVGTDAEIVGNADVLSNLNVGQDADVSGNGNIAGGLDVGTDLTVGNNANVSGRFRLGADVNPRLTFPDASVIPNFSDPRVLVFQNNTAQADLEPWPFEATGFLPGSSYELGLYELRTTTTPLNYNPGEVGQSTGPTPTNLAGLATNAINFHRDNLAGTDRRPVLGEIKAGDLILAVKPAVVVEWLVFRATGNFQAFGSVNFGNIDVLFGANAPITVGDQIRFYVFSISTV